MGFNKGRKKTGGRRRGTPNKSTKHLRACISDIIESELESFSEKLNQLDPKQRVDTIIKLLPYVMSKIPLEEEEESDKRHFTIEVLKSAKANLKA
jgi:hypothetical protein